MLLRVKSTLILTVLLMVCAAASLFIGVVDFSVMDIFSGNWEAFEILMISRLD